jgi:hypothetical protein
MPTLDLGEYFERHRHGNAVLQHEDRLRDLGLIVQKKLFGTLVPVGSGGVIRFYDLTFERRDQSFSAELVSVLQDEIKLSFAEVQQLEQQAAFRN